MKPSTRHYWNGLKSVLMDYSKLRDLILGSNFNSVKKLIAYEKIKSEFNVLHYFNQKNEIVKNIDNVLSYDLTHSIGNFLHDIEISDYIEGNRKKR